MFTFSFATTYAFLYYSLLEVCSQRPKSAVTMWGLSKLIPALLAAAVPKTTTDLATTFRKLYSDLGEKGAVYHRVSPTIKFVYVTTPPTPGTTWSDDHVILSDEHMMQEGTNMFENVAGKHETLKPIALYLPGLDGFGISASSNQFDDLSSSFELWRMHITIHDRSSFGDLMKHVSNFVDEVSNASNRPVYLIGESFSGLLAPGVALRLQNRERQGGIITPIKGVVMVNPATSFDDSSWAVTVPLLTTLSTLTQNSPRPFNLPSPYSVLGGLILSASIPSQEQYKGILTLMRQLEIGSNPSQILKSLEGMSDMFDVVEEQLPAGLLQHRLTEWLMVGSSLVNPRLSQLDVPTLVVVGSDDNLLSSGKEASRLEKILPQFEKLVVNRAGHFILDWNVNLTEAILYSKLDPLNFKETKRPYDPIVDWKLPQKDFIDQTLKNTVKPLEDLFSPVFMTTDENGKRIMGMGNLPKTEGPLLFVSNHQLLGLDMNMVVAEFLKNDVTVRGLAHPVIFSGPSPGRGELEDRVPGINRKTTEGGGAAGIGSTADFRRFGAIMVTPRNFYRVMQTGQNALLFPGGAREVFHRRGEAYQLFWPEKVDFIRTAARFNATIIPLSAVGMADSLNIVMDSVANLPFVGKGAVAFAKNATAARYDAPDDSEELIPPVITPGLPSRNYFLFGKPLSTKDLDPKDKEACKTAYLQIKNETNKGFEDILRAREKDQYKDAPQRLAYERFTGNKAPTFDIKEVNR